MRAKILPLIVAFFFFFSSSTNAEELNYMSYKGKLVVVAVKGYVEPFKVAFFAGILKSISDDEIILENTKLLNLFMLNPKALEGYSILDKESKELIKNLLLADSTIIIKRSEVIAIAIPKLDDKK